MPVPSISDTALPQMLLHPRHMQDLSQLPLQSNAKLKPIPFKGFAQVSIDIGDLRKLPRVRVQGSQLLPCGEHAEALFQPVSLLLADVFMSIDIGNGLPVLAVTAGVYGSEAGDDSSAEPDAGSLANRGSEAGTWLLLVLGGEAAGHRALHRLGRAGAIRRDFAEEFSLANEALGIGSQASAFLLHPRRGCPMGHTELVAKIPLPSTDEGTGCDGGLLPHNVCQEVSILTSLALHPHIVEFYGLFHTGGDSRDPGAAPLWAIVVEFCCGGDLFDHVRAAPLAEDRAKQITQGLVSALAHIHSQGIMHRDVKPENVLLARGDRPVLADFGIACHMEDTAEGVRRCGTPGYAAPEIISGKAYGVKVDSFSAGVLLHFILSQLTPFRGRSIKSTLKKTLQCPVDFSRSPYLNAVSATCKEFMLLLLAKHHSKRISSSEAQQHAWFTSHFVYTAKAPTPPRLNEGAATMSSLTDEPQGPGDPKPPVNASVSFGPGDSAIPPGPPAATWRVSPPEPARPPEAASGPSSHQDLPSASHGRSKLSSAMRSSIGRLRLGQMPTLVAERAPTSGSQSRKSSFSSTARSSMSSAQRMGGIDELVSLDASSSIPEDELALMFQGYNSLQDEGTVATEQIVDVADGQSPAKHAGSRKAAGGSWTNLRHSLDKQIVKVSGQEDRHGDRATNQEEVACENFQVGRLSRLRASFCLRVRWRKHQPTTTQPLATSQGQPIHSDGSGAKAWTSLMPCRQQDLQEPQPLMLPGVVT